MLRAPMKFLQAVRTSAKVKDPARVLGADGMSDWFFSQTYRADLQGFGLTEVSLRPVKEERAATGTAEEIRYAPVTEGERRIRGDAESNQ